MESRVSFLVYCYLIFYGTLFLTPPFVQISHCVTAELVDSSKYKSLLLPAGIECILVKQNYEQLHQDIYLYRNCKKMSSQACIVSCAAVFVIGESTLQNDA